MAPASSSISSGHLLSVNSSRSTMTSSVKERSPPSKNRNKTPGGKWRRRATPAMSAKTKSQKSENRESLKNARETPKNVSEVVEDSDSGDEESFMDHVDLCERMAKTFYFANKLPSTPRPSLPLTMLAVNTFASTARKDTLEFLDVEMAAEIGRNACVSPTALIMALIYLERLSGHNPGYLNSIKPSELFVVSLLVASKFMQDDGEDLGIFNDEWATSAKMELKSLNRLELEFLTAIDWRVNVQKDEYDKILLRLEEKLALDQGMRRGWFTYTELLNLTNSLLSWNLIWPTLYEHCVKVVSAAYVTYATILATLLTSSMLAPQIFLFSKAFITSSMDSFPSLSSVSNNNCPYAGFANSSSTSPLPLGSKTLKNFSQGDMSRLVEAEDLVLGDENETDTSFLRYHKDITDSISPSGIKWRDRMRANSRVDLRLLEHRRDQELCRQGQEGNGAGTWNEEAFVHYLKQFLELNAKPDGGTKVIRNLRNRQTCSQYLNANNLGLPLGSVVRV